MAMPYYKNGSVARIMGKRFLTCHEILRYSVHFLSGLHNIHSKGLLHFDIKPENFLISDSDTVMLADFGVAQHTGAYGFAKINVTTERFAPPEFFDQVDLHNNKFDVYQSGLSMFRMCNGDVVFESEFAKAWLIKGTKTSANYIKNLQAGKFPTKSSFLPHIPKALRKVVFKAMSADPDRRYPTVLDMLNALSSVENTNDWQLVLNTDDGQSWVKDGGFEVNATKLGTEWTIHASKNNRKMKPYCESSLSDEDKDDMLYDCLNQEWKWK
jgi:serine/threonine protein kinase